MVERRSRRERYIVAGIITAIIFLLGFSIGLVVEGKRVAFVQDQLAAQKIDFSSSQLQYDYISSLDSQESCPAIFASFNKNLDRLDATRLRLESYSNDNTISEESFDLLRREYTLEQIRYWMLSERARTICDDNFVRVLYFFSDEEACPDCQNQQTVLLYYKKLFQQDLLIFSLDSEFIEEPMIPILMKRYNITQFPSLIVENEVFSGYANRETAENALCDQYLAKENASLSEAVREVCET